MKSTSWKKLAIGLSVVCLTAVLAGCGGDKKTSAPAGGTKSADGVQTWVAYEVGAAGYNQAAAIANAMTQKLGSKVRIMPADTSVGRIIAMKNGQAKFGFLADEVYFAANGLYDFAAKNQGPQDLRVVLGKPSSYLFAVTKKGGIKTIADLKGKRISYVPGNTSHNIKNEAYLYGYGLTWDDVKKTQMASYGAGMKALLEDKVDAVGVQTTASTLYEIDASPVGLAYIEMPAKDVEAWKRIQEYAPWVKPGKEDRGAGLTKGKPIEVPWYPYPQVACYSNATVDEVYQMIKSMDETYDIYKDLDPQSSDWKVDISSGFPVGAPFHDGAIKYLKEKKLWTPEHEKWNQDTIARQKKVQDAWKVVIEEAKVQKVSDKDFPAFWTKRRAEITGFKN